ncbi:MAG: ABC transporter permease [Solirubrobacterales bacterium]
MGDLTLVLRQTYYGLLSTRRNPRAVVFALLFPIIFLFLFNSIFASSGNNDNTVDVNGTTLDLNTYFTAGLIAYAIMLNCYSTLIVSLTTQRESGQLKRYRGTPVPSWTFIASLVLRSILLVAVMVVVMVAIGSAAYGVDIHGTAVVGLVVYAVLGTATMCALGIAVSAFCPTADAAGTIGPFSAVILSFISSVFIPIDQLPHWLQEVGKVFPLYHLATGLQISFGTSSGTGLSADNVAVLALWTIGGGVAAARNFRWEPQARG